MSRLPTETPNRTSDALASRWARRATVFVSAGLALVAVLAFLTWYFGGVRGQEFCPERFQRRTFSYYELPLLGWQVWPIRREDCTGSLETYLVREKMVLSEIGTGEAGQWDLVSATRGFASPAAARSAQGDARILCEYLTAQDAAGELVWLEWTKRHRERAGVIWPAVAELARQRLYVFIPELLWRARTAVDDRGFQAEIDFALARHYCSLALVHQQLGRHETALELFNEALRHRPAVEVALSGRARSLEALGAGSTGDDQPAPASVP